MSASSVFCGECGQQLDELPSTPSAARVPCPICGSLRRRFNRGLGVTIAPHSAVAVKLKRGGRGRPALEQRVGDDLHRATGQWNRLERVVSREQDEYHERISDLQTGAVLREIHEPLSRHTGHGSAKPRHATKKPKAP